MALSDAGSPYDAAEYCDGLTAHGHSNWYLPTEDELYLFWNGGSPVAGVLTDGSWYWPSTENSDSSVRARRFSDDSQGSFGKNANLLVRCVRQWDVSVGSSCNSPAGDAGAILYNSDHSVMQWCDGGQWIGFKRPPIPKTVFVTSTTYDGNLGGIPGANGICKTRASAASLSLHVAGVLRDERLQHLQDELDRVTSDGREQYERGEGCAKVHPWQSFISAGS